MSTSELTSTSTLGDAREELRRVRVLRYALGVATAAAIAFFFRWPLFYVGPLFAAFFLALPLPGPSAAQAIGLFAAIFVAFFFGLVFSLFLLPYPLVFVPLLSLVLFFIYYGVNRGLSPILAIMTLLAVFLLPIISLSDYALASGVMYYFVLSSGLAVATYLVAHAVVSDPAVAGEEQAARPPVSSGYVPAAAVAALKSVIVVLPMAVLFLNMNWVSEVIVIVFVAFFSLMPSASASFGEGLKALVSNLVGAAVAVIFYWLIVAVPQYAFFVVLMLLTMLGFGSAIFSNRDWSRYMPSASITMLVLIGPSIGEDVDFSGMLVARIFLIGLSVAYVVGAMALLDWLLPNPGDHSSPA